MSPVALAPRGEYASSIVGPSISVPVRALPTGARSGSHLSGGRRMFERCHRRNVPIIHRSGRSIATLILSTAGIALVGVGWSIGGPLGGASAVTEAQVKAPPEPAPAGFAAPPPAPAPSI